MLLTPIGLGLQHPTVRKCRGIVRNSAGQRQIGGRPLRRQRLRSEFKVYYSKHKKQADQAMLGPRQEGGRQGGRPLFNEGDPPEYTGASGEDLRAYRERLHAWRGDYRHFLREQARLRQEGQARLREVHSRRARETAQALAELQVGRPTLLVRSCM